MLCFFILSNWSIKINSFYLIIYRYGRRIAFFSNLVLVVFLPVISAFSPTYPFYIVMRFLMGFTFPAVFQIPFILGMYVKLHFERFPAVDFIGNQKKKKTFNNFLFNPVINKCRHLIDYTSRTLLVGTILLLACFINSRLIYN